MKKQPTSLLHFLTELVRQTKELYQRTTRQIPASGERADASSPQQDRPERDATGEAGQEKENVPPPDRVIQAEKAAAKGGARLEDPPEEGGATEQPPAGPRENVPPSQAPAEEGSERAVRPEWRGAGGDLKNRFDSAQDRVRNQAQSDEELQALLDQAITLLESVSQHPALRDYSANQRKLEEIEQRLGQSGNV